MRYLITFVLLAAVALGGCRRGEPPRTVVTYSGFVVDTTLGDLTFCEREQVGFTTVRDAYARVDRWWEKDGERSYLMHPPTRRYRQSAADYRSMLESMKDSVRLIYHFSEDSFHINPVDSVGYYRGVTNRLSFVYDHHVGVVCYVSVTFDTIPSYRKKVADTVKIAGRVEILTYSDIYSDNNLYQPDSTYLAFDRLPTDQGGITGRVYASSRDFSRSLGDVFFEGEFRVDMSPAQYRDDLLW